MVYSLIPLSQMVKRWIVKNGSLINNACFVIFQITVSRSTFIEENLCWPTYRDV